jgi:hypothetical protein
MDGFVSQRIGNGECASVDRRARGRRANGRNVTNRAAYQVKVLFNEVPSAVIGHAGAPMSIA